MANAQKASLRLAYNGDRCGNAEHRRALNRERLRRFRARRQGRRYRNCAWVIFDGGVLDMLIKLGWLADSKSTDAREVGQAISDLLGDIAHRT